jgi:hypothetical protein
MPGAFSSIWSCALARLPCKVIISVHLACLMINGICRRALNSTAAAEFTRASRRYQDLPLVSEEVASQLPLLDQFSSDCSDQREVR